MKKIILNELDYAEKALKEHSLLGSPTETLKIIGKYFAQKGFSKKAIVAKLEDFMLCCDETINLVKWQTSIETFAKSAKKFSLVQLNYIPITSSELKVIDEQIAGGQQKRLMFTLLCLAKYGNAVNPHNNNWTNTENKDIFQLANIKTSIERQSLLINSLYQDGFVGYSKVIDNLNINVKIIDDNSDIQLYITDFRNLGNQYRKYIGEPFIECENCGLVVPKKTNNQRYCVDCAKEIDRQKSILRWEKSVAKS